MRQFLPPPFTFISKSRRDLLDATHRLGLKWTLLFSRFFISLFILIKNTFSWVHFRHRFPFRVRYSQNRTAASSVDSGLVFIDGDDEWNYFFVLKSPSSLLFKKKSKFNKRTKKSIAAIKVRTSSSPASQSNRIKKERNWREELNKKKREWNTKWPKLATARRFFFSFFLLLFLLGRLNVYLIFEEDLRASFHWGSSASLSSFLFFLLERATLFFFLNCFFFFFFLNFVGCVDCVALLSVFFLVKFKYRHDPRFSLGKFRFDNNIRLCSRFLISFLYLFLKKELIRLKCCSMLKKKEFVLWKLKDRVLFLLATVSSGPPMRGLFLFLLIRWFIYLFECFRRWNDDERRVWSANRISATDIWKCDAPKAVCVTKNWASNSVAPFNPRRPRITQNNSI